MTSQVFTISSNTLSPLQLPTRTTPPGKSLLFLNPMKCLWNYIAIPTQVQRVDCYPVFLPRIHFVFSHQWRVVKEHVFIPGLWALSFGMFLSLAQEQIKQVLSATPWSLTLSEPCHARGFSCRVVLATLGRWRGGVFLPHLPITAHLHHWQSVMSTW